MAALLAGTITDRVAAGDYPPGFYAARRYFDGSNVFLAFVTNINPDNAGYGVPNLQVGQLGTTGGTSQFSPTYAYNGGLSATGQSVCWSEDIDRSLPPVLLYSSVQTNNTTYGVVLPTAGVSPSWNIMWDGSSGGLKSAVTVSGSVRVYSDKLRLVVATTAQGACADPPMRLVDDPPTGGTNVCMYNGGAPFTAPNVNTLDTPLPPTGGLSILEPPTNPNCYYIQFGSPGVGSKVTVLFNYTPNGGDLYCVQFTAPYAATNEFAAATIWAISAGSPVVTQTGTLTARSVVLTNDGTPLAIVADSSDSSLKLFKVTTFGSRADSIVVADTTILQSAYANGVIYAFGIDKLIWFSQSYHNFRVINLTSLTCSAPAVTNFGSPALVSYMGMSSDNSTMFVAVASSSNNTVQVHSYSSTSWAAGSTYFVGNPNYIQQLLIDTIEYMSSALIVAVCDSTTLYEEVLLEP
jgi:hypothetical protein